MSKDDFLRNGVTWACLKKLGHLPCSREALIIEAMGGDENIQIIKNKKSGPRKTLESGVMCCDFRGVGKVEHIFFFCEELNKSVSQ